MYRYDDALRKHKYNVFWVFFFFFFFTYPGGNSYFFNIMAGFSQCNTLAYW